MPQRVSAVQHTAFVLYCLCESDLPRCSNPYRCRFDYRPNGNQSIYTRVRPGDVSVISSRSAMMDGGEGVKNGGGSEGRVPSELGGGEVEPLTNEVRVSGERE